MVPPPDASPTPSPEAPDLTWDARFLAYKWVVALAAGALEFSLYVVTGLRQTPRSPTMLMTAVDQAIPFLPWTVWCYLPVYAAIFVIAIISFKTRRLFHRAVVGTFVAAGLGALSHVFIAAEYPRPLVLAPYPDLSHAFMAYVQRIDPAWNVFPSLHVAHATALALLIREERPRVGAVSLGLAMLLAASTLTTKQHFIADVIAGLAMASVCSAIILRPFRARTSGLLRARTGQAVVPDSPSRLSPSRSRATGPARSAGTET